MTSLSSASSSSLAPPLSPLPPHVRQSLPDPMIPWAISERIFSQMQTQMLSSEQPYKKTEVLPTDPEWRFV